MYFSFLFFFSKIEAKNEFNTRFLIGNIGKKTWPSASLRRNIPCTNDNADSLETAKTPIIDITKDEATLLGYMPQRNDFEWVNHVLLYIFI